MLGLGRLVLFCDSLVSEKHNKKLADTRKNITLFRIIIMLCGIDNIPWNIVSPTEHCYQCK